MACESSEEQIFKTIRSFSACLKSVYTSYTSAVQNRPQVKPTKNGIALNNNACSRNQWFYWLMKSLCSSDSVNEEKKTID